MARARYVVHAPLEGVRILGAALTPPMHSQAMSWMSRGAVYGQPGTQAVSAPPPVAVRQSLVNLAAAGISTSSDAPNVWFPRLYREADIVKEHAPVARVSDNQLPVPAEVSPSVILSRRAYVARIGGQRQIYQPQVVQRWLGINGR